MSQPIVLYDADGKQVVLYAPTYAREQVGAGLLFLAPPENRNQPHRVEVSAAADTSTRPLSGLTAKQLRDLAKAEDVPKYYRMTKAQLIEVLTDG